MFKSVWSKDYKTEVKIEVNCGWDIIDRASYLDNVKLISSMIRGGHQLKIQQTKLADSQLHQDEFYLSPLEKKRMSISQKKAVIDWKNEKVKNYQKAYQKFTEEQIKQVYDEQINKEVEKRKQQQQTPKESIKTP